MTGCDDIWDEESQKQLKMTENGPPDISAPQHPSMYDQVLAKL